MRSRCQLSQLRFSYSHARFGRPDHRQLGATSSIFPDIIFGTPVAFRFRKRAPATRVDTGAKWNCSVCCCRPESEETNRQASESILHPASIQIKNALAKSAAGASCPDCRVGHQPGLQLLLWVVNQLQIAASNGGTTMLLLRIDDVKRHRRLPAISAQRALEKVTLRV